MIKQLLLLFLFGLFSIASFSQASHLLLVTSDGIRWQEVFQGADSSLLFNPKWVADTALYHQKYWSSDPQERRRKLMPFMWSIMATQGQIHGNRKLGSRVNVANQIRISYPGYAEILTGRADPRIFDNHPWPDHHPNVLQALAQKPDFEKIAVFASWSNLYYVLNAPKCNFPVNAGSSRPAIKNWKKDPPPENAQFWSPAILHTINRRDSITWRLAHTSFEKDRPTVLYVSLMESDLIAHKGRYDRTLDAIHTLDSLVGDLWQKMQNDPEYRGKTALFMTTDHGRGRGGFCGNWRVHNHLTVGSGQIWFSALSPDLPALGEVQGKKKNIKAKQFARTIAGLVGYDFKEKRTGKAVCMQPLQSVPADPGKTGAMGKKK